MEFGQSGDVMKKRTSFGLSVADEKIKLIDILSEDDYFLVSSPLQSSISEIERMEQKEKNLFYGNSEESRPSFLRRSLAWDSAFLNNSGVLDQEELLFINNGASETSLLPPNHEVRNRTYEPESTPNDAGFSEDWFELQPSFIESMTSKSLNLNVVERKSSKSGLNPIVQSSRNGDMLCKNKMKTNPTSIGKSINVESEGKMKKESSIRRASCNMNLSRISNLSMDNKSMKTSLGKGLVMQEKTANKSSSSSSNLQPFSSLSSTKFSPIFSPITATPSTLSRRKSESKKPQNSAPVRKKWIWNNSASTQYSGASGQFQALLSPVHKQRRSVDSKDVKEASNMRPSELRPPSPRHRFFDEQAERSRKLPQRNHRNPSSESAKGGASTTDKQTEKKKVHFPADQLDNLCTSFEGFALKSERINCGSSRTASSRPCRRTPLADRPSKCNFSGALASPLMEPKKEKLVRRASYLRYV
ncbi:hypothetical protein AAHA92_12914 [Salvia divinorum]|uniref:Uncharacterized protein n=1 Tax=Salvia divinorum TaxID=28513 RepID=A0ABD1H6L8_SALDI